MYLKSSNSRSPLIAASLSVLFVTLVGLTASAKKPATDFTLVAVQNGMQLKTPDGRVVFEYKTKKPDDIGLTSPSAAYFDPINTPSGERVTNVAPDDHPHHRGMFLGFID